MTRYHFRSSCSFNSQTPEPIDSIRRVAETGISPCCNCHSENPRSARTESGKPVSTSREFPSQWIAAGFCVEGFLTQPMYQEFHRTLYKIYYNSVPGLKRARIRYTNF